MIKLAIVGPGGSGKSLAAEYLAHVTSLRFTGECSRVICPHAAARLGISEHEAYATRHASRDLWRRLGDDLRAHDPAALARETLREGNICVGIRARVEMDAVRNERLVQWVVWVQRDTPNDSTLEFGPDVADVVIDNNASVEVFCRRLRSFARHLGVLRRRWAIGHVWWWTKQVLHGLVERPRTPALDTSGIRWYTQPIGFHSVHSRSYAKLASRKR